MGEYLLELLPYGKMPASTPLLSESNWRTDVETLYECVTGDCCIYSDLSYRFHIIGNGPVDIRNVLVYVNDNYEPANYKDGYVSFSEPNGRERMLFLDCYGFIEIGLTIQYESGEEATFHTDYLPVMVRKGTLNDSVKAMVDYIYTHQEDFLMNGDIKPRSVANLKEDGYKSLAAHIILAEEVVDVYESSYGYFKANSRFRIEKEMAVDHLSKLQFVTPSTIQYIAQHPEELQLVNSNIGIRSGNRIYHPRKTLVTTNIYSRDIYENRVIVGFLQTLLNSIAELLTSVKELLTRIPLADNPEGEYVYSSNFIFAETKRTLEGYHARLANLKRMLQTLWGNYREIMGLEMTPLTGPPQPSAIFMSVPQYNKIFTHIHKWYTFGVYDLSKETLMLSFVKISYLYESYIFTKLVNFFQEKGYSLTAAKMVSYSARKLYKYRNTSCNNTFEFIKGNMRVTLYYQPVIYCDDSHEINGIWLYRNNSISLMNDNEEERRGRYYVPDFLLKVEESGYSRYVIIDAKFSSYNNVRKYYIANLAYKYLFSISPVQETDKLVGLCIIYGQCVEADRQRSVYDHQGAHTLISPFAETIPMVEGLNTESHLWGLERVLNKALSSSSPPVHLP